MVNWWAYPHILASSSNKYLPVLLYILFFFYSFSHLLFLVCFVDDRKIPYTQLQFCLDHIFTYFQCSTHSFHERGIFLRIYSEWRAQRIRIVPGCGLTRNDSHTAHTNVPRKWCNALYFAIVFWWWLLATIFHFNFIFLTRGRSVIKIELQLLTTTF